MKVSKELMLHIEKAIESFEEIPEPSDIEKRVKSLEKGWSELCEENEELLERIEALENTPIVERKKRNLSIDTPTIEWKEIFERKKTVINCESEEEAVELLKIADGLGYKWNDGTKYKKDICYFDYEQNTCYNIKEGGYSDIEFYTKKNFTILRYRDIINPPKQDDWKKVECLSWEDIMEVASICTGKSFASGYNADRITLETFIKNKLKK